MKRWCVGDVMTRDVVSVASVTGYKEMADLMVGRGISAVPVVDAERRVLGVVSEADLLAKLEYADRIPRHPLASRRLRTIRQKVSGDTALELMTTPAVTIPVTETVTRAARLLDAARIKRLPVVDEEDRLVGIVSRRDLLRIYTRPDRLVRMSVIEGVLRLLRIDPARVQVDVRSGIVTLAGHLDLRSSCDVVVAFAGATPGVVDVVDKLDWDIDDRAVLTTLHG